jgi:hypothetical protein
MDNDITNEGRHVLRELTKVVNGIRSAHLCTFVGETLQTAEYDIGRSQIVLTFKSGRRLIVSALRDEVGNPMVDFSS